MDILHPNALKSFSHFPAEAGATRRLNSSLTAHFPATRQMQPKQGSVLILRTIRHKDFHFITSLKYTVTLCLPAIQPPVPVIRENLLKVKTPGIHGQLIKKRECVYS